MRTFVKSTLLLCFVLPLLFENPAMAQSIRGVLINAERARQQPEKETPALSPAQLQSRNDRAWREQNRELPNQVRRDGINARQEERQRAADEARKALQILQMNLIISDAQMQRQMVPVPVRVDPTNGTFRPQPRTVRRSVIVPPQVIRPIRPVGNSAWYNRYL